jgi:hypothetical protein
MELVQQELPSDSGKIIIRTVEDLKKTRCLILENNQMFDFNVNSINAVHRGDFSLENCPEDEARIYAHWVMRRVMRNTLTSRKLVSAEVQTVELDPIKQGDDSDSDDSRRQNEMFRRAPKALYYLIRQSRFIRLLGGTDFSSRTPKPFDWVIRMIRSIFDEKTVDDRTNERDSLPIMPLPEYILIWAKREWSSDVGDLAIKGCWDVFISAHHHMQKYLEVTLFVRFLDEMWTTEQLSFFLECRTWGLQRCVSIPMDHEELSEYFTETYMTKGQVDEFFHFFFANTEQELVDDLAIRGCSCVDPLRGDENEAAYIPLQRVLELAVGEKINETVRQLRKMVAFYKPVPRMTSKRFSLFVKTLIHNIDSNCADSLYRSSLAPNTVRVEMNTDEFAEFYASDRPVLPGEWKSESVSSDQFAPYSMIYSMVLSRWQKFLPFFNRMIDVISKQSYEEAKIMTNEIRHQKYQLLEAKVAFDGVLFFQAYHRVLQTVLRSCFKMNYPEAFLFTRQISDLVDLLTKKYEKVCDADDDGETPASPEKKKKVEEDSDEAEDVPPSPPPPKVPEPAPQDPPKQMEEEADDEAVEELADDELR